MLEKRRKKMKMNLASKYHLPRIRDDGGNNIHIRDDGGFTWTNNELCTYIENLVAAMDRAIGYIKIYPRGKIMDTCATILQDAIFSRGKSTMISSTEQNHVIEDKINLQASEPKNDEPLHCCDACGRPFYIVGYCDACGRPFYNPLENGHVCGAYPEGWSSDCQGTLILGERPGCEHCGFHVNNCGKGHEEVFLCPEFKKRKGETT